MIVENLKILLTADANGIERGFQKASASVKQLGEQLNKVGNVLGFVGTALTAFGGLMIREAGKYSSSVKSALDGLANSFASLAVQIGTALVPVVRVMTGVFAEINRWMSSLDSDTKKAVIQWAAVGAVFATVGGAGFKLVGTLLQLAPTILPVLPIILAIGGALAGIVLIVGAVKMAWDADVGGMQERWREFVNYLGSTIDMWGDHVRETIAETARFISRVLKTYANVIDDPKSPGWLPPPDAVKKFADSVRATAKDIRKFAIKIERDDGWKELIQDTKDFAGSTKDALVDTARAAAEGIASAFKTGLDTLGISGFVDKVMGEIGKLSGAAGKVPKRQTLDEIKRQADEARRRIDELVKETLAAHQRSVEAADKVIASFSGGVAGAIARAGGAMDHAMELVDRGMTDAAVQFAEGVRAAADGLVNKFMGKLGRVGDTINTAMQGFQVGGIWGAIIAVLADLLTSSPQFVEIIQQVTRGLEMISRFLGGFLGPFLSITESSTALLEVLALLSPVIAALNVPLQYFATVLKASAIALLRVAKFVADAYNSMLSGVQGLLFDIASALGDNFLGNAVRKLGLALENARINTTGINTALNNLSGNMTVAGSDIAGAGERAANALDTVTEGLLNAPAGFKVEKYRYAAMQGVADPFVSRGEAPVSVAVYIDSRQVAAEVQRRQSLELFQRSGAFG